MFYPLTTRERQDFFRQNVDSFVPGYTGHCPTLRFHYGKSYGAKTKEILQELRDARVLADGRLSAPYRSDDSRALSVLKSIPAAARDHAFRPASRTFPRYITGYTGFVPTLNFRYGKSYGRAADDSMCEFAAAKRRRAESGAAAAAVQTKGAAPTRLAPIRGRDEVERMMREGGRRVSERRISAEDPPIAGYTGHIPRVRGGEESLSQRYGTVVRRGLKMLSEERERRRATKNVQEKIAGILQAEEEMRKTGGERGTFNGSDVTADG